MLGLDHLPHMRKGEKVLLLLRRDLTVIVLIALRFVALGLLPLLARWYLLRFFPDALVSEVVRPVLILLTYAFYLFLWLFFYRGFLDYYLDAWIVTTHRILNIELQGLFNRVVAEQKLFRIQDVTTEQKGFLSHFFHYGDVYIQTAGTKQRFVFEQVAHPNRIARQVIELVEWYKRVHPEDKN